MKQPPLQAQRSTVKNKASSRGSSTPQHQEGTNQNKVGPAPHRSAGKVAAGPAPDIDGSLGEMCSVQMNACMNGTWYLRNDDTDSSIRPWLPAA
eukprot:1139407-Pelagomonas_calceolata.AAC.1